MKTYSWGRRFKRILLTGLFIVAPASLTFILLSWFVQALDHALAAPVAGLVGRPLPGLGLVTALVIVLAVGVLGSNIAGQHMLEVVEELLLRIPVFNWLYRTIKQVSVVFSPTNKSGFRSVVLVEYPRPGVYSIGFATNQVTLREGDKRTELVSVFIPTNHMYIGDTVLVPKDKVIATDLTQQQGIQATISAGATMPDLIKSLRPPA